MLCPFLALMGHRPRTGNDVTIPSHEVRSCPDPPPRLDQHCRASFPQPVSPPVHALRPPGFRVEERKKAKQAAEVVRNARKVERQEKGEKKGGRTGLKGSRWRQGLTTVVAFSWRHAILHEFWSASVKMTHLEQPRPEAKVEELGGSGLVFVVLVHDPEARDQHKRRELVHTSA